VKIPTKINLLLLTSVIALIATSLISNAFRSQGLAYYALVDEIRTLQISAGEALAFEKNFEKTFGDQDLVYSALDKADMQLGEIHTELLKEHSSRIDELGSLLNVFRDSFVRMEENVTELLSKKDQINVAIAAYSSKYDQAVVRIDEEIAGGLLTMTDVNTTVLQVLKNDSLAAFTSINRIVVLVNMDLILEGHVTSFKEDYEQVIRRLETQQKNIAFHVVSLDDPFYTELSQQSTRAYLEILSLVPELESLYVEIRQISQHLLENRTQIGDVIQQVTEQSNTLRKQENRNVTILQLLVQAMIILLLLSGGYLFARSISNPLIALTKVTRAVSEGDYSGELGITSRDEIGQLAHDFILMRENLKQSFELIDEQKAQYQSIFENAIEGIFQSAPDGSLLRVNQALARISGYTSPEEMIDAVSSTREQLYLHPSDHERFVGILEADGAVREFETVFKQKSGSVIPVIVNAQAIYDEDQETHYTQGMIEDISERKWMEEYKIAKDAAEKSNKAKSEFLAHMSHELRTPLNAILGFAQLLRRSDNLNSVQYDNLNIINRSGEHLLSLINNVLDMSRIESGQLSLNRTDFVLSELLSEVRDLFKIRAEKKGLHLQTSIQDDLPQYVNADEDRLRQVLVNLVGNAIKFTDRGSVVVRVLNGREGPTDEDQSRRCIHFEIEDTGPGIPENEINSIFEPFVQAKSRIVDAEGTGLGLAICSRFVALMGGTIDVRSKEGTGTTFEVSVPLLIGTQAVGQDRMAHHPIGYRTEDGPDGAKIRFRVLIVDDISANRQVLSQILSPFGFDIEEAANGSEAVGVCRSWHPHLVWMDIRMPILDGYDATRQIKRLPAGKDTIVIAISASALADEEEEAMAAGCDDFVAKPFRDSEILGMMQKHLSLELVYEGVDPAGDADENERPSLDVRLVEGLSTAWRLEMKQAVEHLDLERVSILLDQIRNQNSELAGAIQERIDEFEYKGILAVLC
jgi:PAS domain S-box-containing protein